MKIGLVGFAGSGKTTVFNTMTGLDIPVGYGGDVRLGTVRVPDKRIDALTKIFLPKKRTYAEISFCDVPGEHGSHKKGLSPRGLQQIRDQEALCQVLQDFNNPALEGAPDPLLDLESFHTECIFADLEIIEKRLDRARKEQADAHEIATFELAQANLEAERPLRLIPDADLDRSLIKGYGILTDRPLLVVVNRDEELASNRLTGTLDARIREFGAAGLSLCASIEADIAGMEPGDQKEFLADLGLKESALSRFIELIFCED